jgi:hypothetical protein
MRRDVAGLVVLLNSSDSVRRETDVLAGLCAKDVVHEGVGCNEGRPALRMGAAHQPE